MSSDPLMSSVDISDTVLYVIISTSNISQQMYQSGSRSYSVFTSTEKNRHNKKHSKSQINTNDRTVKQEL